MAVKEKIFQGDTFPVSLECRKPNPDDLNDSRGLPATPSSAFARLLDTQAQEFLEIGGTGDTTDDVIILPATGSQADDRGAIISYIVTADFTQIAGDFKLYITAEFPDGAILTEDRAFKVLEYR